MALRWTRDALSLTVFLPPPYSNHRYLKYLAKKFLCKHEIRDYVRVVASNSTTYELRYFNVNADEEEEADE